MAIAQNPITGRMRGKYGNGVFVTLYGKNILRTKPIKIKNPKTKKQTKNRNKMTVVIAYLKMVKMIIKVGWKEEAVERSGFHAATSYHLNYALMDVGGEWVMDAEKIMNAKGSLMKASNLAAVNPSGQTIEYTWDDNSGEENAREDDVFCYVVYNITLQEKSAGVSTTKRVDRIFTINEDGKWTGNEVAVYGFFVSADGRIASDDSYLGSFVMK